MNPSRIHVYCRLRPVDDGSGSVKSYPPTLCDENYVALSVLDRSTLFAVDKLFDHHSQEGIFQESVEPLIEDVISGINCTVFTYGQTGSGKTHTIIGGATDEKQGLLPRAIESIFQRIKSFENDMCANKSDFVVQASILEIYHEKLRDLISTEKNVQNLAIRENSDGTIWVENLTEHSIQNSLEYSRLLQQALKRRIVGSHKMNDQSSRSHLCCIISLTCKDITNNRVLRSKLSLIDLAGSEMAKKTDAIGQRFEEAKFINKSLSALSKVIHALSTQQSNDNSSKPNTQLSSSHKLNICTSGAPAHIPYRDSKLTRLLQHSLSGNAKTVIFLTISNSFHHAAETISTLKFGERARLVVTKPRINVDFEAQSAVSIAHRAQVEGYRSEIQEYQRMIEQLQQQVLSMQTIIYDLQQQQLQSNQQKVIPTSSSCAICPHCSQKQETAVNKSLDRPREGDKIMSDKSLDLGFSTDSELPRNEKSELESEQEEAEAKDDAETDTDDEYSDRCGICGLNQQESDRLHDSTGENLGFFFHCDGNCGSMFHVRCVGLIGEAGQYVLPEGEWFCLSCQHDLDQSEKLSVRIANHHEVGEESYLTNETVTIEEKKLSNSSGGVTGSLPLAVSQQELHMAELWQNQYDVIRKDRNRILLQWQQDQESFRCNQEERQKQQEARETLILQLEDQQQALVLSVTQQQEENATLKSCIQELQQRCAALQQQVFDSSAIVTKATTASSLETLSSVLMPKVSYGSDEEPRSIKSHSTNGIAHEGSREPPKYVAQTRVRNDRYHRYDAEFELDEDDEPKSAHDMVDERSIRLPRFGDHETENRVLFQNKCFEKIVLSTKELQEKLSSTKLSSHSQILTNENSTRKKSKMTSLSTSQPVALHNQPIHLLTRSSSEKATSTESNNENDSGALQGGILPTSRFVNPLRNRLSELLAQADEEKESFVELRMKLQSRSELRASASKDSLKNL